MVGVLISMKFAMLRHSPKGTRLAGWIIGALLVVATWAGGLMPTSAEVRSEVLMLILAGWFVGAALGPVTMSGVGVLRAEYFTLLPIDRKKLALGLLGAVFPGVASAYLLLAGLAILVQAIALNPVAAVIAVPAAVLSWVLTIIVSRLIYAALGSAMRTWLGVEIAAIQFGFLIAGLLAGWMVVTQAIRTVPELLRNGLPDSVAVTVLSWLPSSWSLRAVEAAAAGDWPVALAWLGLLAVITAGLLALAALLLRPHLGSRAGRRTRRPIGSRVLTGRRLLPATELGAVVGKELRQWWRDPWRKLEWRSGIYTGLLIGVFASVSGMFQLIAPLSGLVIAFMICLSGCNLYGQDGSAAWLTVVGQRRGTVVADVRGRQLAMIILFLPPAALVSAVVIMITGEHWAWPAVLAGLPALIGVASGIAILVSAVGVSPGVDPRRRVGPNDAGGDMTLQVNLSLWICMLLVTPTAGALAVGFAALQPWGPWAAVLIGLLNGALGYWLLGKITISYLTDRLPSLFTRIRYGHNDAGQSTGLLGALETSAQKAEEEARAAKEKEKATRAKKRAADREPTNV
ncbi:hypothetical protein [Microlunatus speluncae]|uniref:hypothetical protein n=1 Tax=Microlunatus speluncae TaxID=2594267 RepID=UPI0012667844|nr:hypothetical protein [Microlunatus speluncae]